MKKILIVFVFSPMLCYSQINESDTLKFKAKLGLTGFFQEGNVETKIFRGRTDISTRLLKKWVFKTTNSYVYQGFGGQKADEDVLSLNFLYFNPERKIYPQLLGFVSSNFRREIDLRYLLGAGVTFQMIEKLNQNLKVSITSEFEYTDFDQQNFNKSEFDGSSTINTIRGTVWVNGKYHFFDKKVILNHECYFQPSIENTRNYRWQADVGIELPIVKFFSFKISYLHTYESVVIDGQKERDRFLTFGLTLKNF